MIKPTGYYVLIKMEEIDKTVTEGALEGFVLQSGDEHDREQTGHDVGIVEAFGPTCFAGYQGIDEKVWVGGPVSKDNPGCRSCTATERAEQWGVQVGDKVEFNRYDGKVPRHPDFQNHRIIQDAHIIGVIEG